MVPVEPAVAGEVDVIGVGCSLPEPLFRRPFPVFLEGVSELSPDLCKLWNGVFERPLVRQRIAYSYECRRLPLPRGELSACGDQSGAEGAYVTSYSLSKQREPSSWG